MSLPRLPAGLEQRARLELNEDPETRVHFLDELREKIKARADLGVDTANIDLIRFLRARKFNVDLAFELVVKHYEAKRNNPEVFSNFSPSAEKSTFESGFNVAFPMRDQMGRKIFAFRPGNWNPSERDLINNLRANLIAMEVLIQDEETQINGVVVIGDFREFGMAQARAMNPLIFKKYGHLLLNCYPVRIKGIHVLDQPKIFSVIFAIVSQFMKEKLRERVKLHGGNILGLHEYIKKELLPSDYGGTGPPTDVTVWVRDIMNSEEDLEHLWF